MSISLVRYLCVFERSNYVFLLGIFFARLFELPKPEASFPLPLFDLDVFNLFFLIWILFRVESSLNFLGYFPIFVSLSFLVGFFFALCEHIFIFVLRPIESSYFD